MIGGAVVAGGATVVAGGAAVVVGPSPCSLTDATLVVGGGAVVVVVGTGGIPSSGRPRDWFSTM
jgi:carbamate kinase